MRIDDVEINTDYALDKGYGPPRRVTAVEIVTEVVDRAPYGRSTTSRKVKVRAWVQGNETFLTVGARYLEPWADYKKKDDEAKAVHDAHAVTVGVLCQALEAWDIQLVDLQPGFTSGIIEIHLDSYAAETLIKALNR